MSENALFRHVSILKRNLISEKAVRLIFLRNVLVEVVFMLVVIKQCYVVKRNKKKFQVVDNVIEGYYKICQISLDAQLASKGIRNEFTSRL